MLTGCQAVSIWYHYQWNNGNLCMELFFDIFSFIHFFQNLLVKVANKIKCLKCSDSERVTKLSSNKIKECSNYLLLPLLSFSWCFCCWWNLSTFWRLSTLRRRESRQTWPRVCQSLPSGRPRSRWRAWWCSSGWQTACRAARPVARWSRGTSWKGWRNRRSQSQDSWGWRPARRPSLPVEKKAKI